jgi:RNA polymerase sigma factor (sigma-70 family)
MPIAPAPTLPWLHDLAAERDRLVRLCARITGDRAAAEDLAQETLAEAHVAAGRLRDPDRWREWLNGIARNVCRRWAERRGRELARSAFVPAGDDAPEPADAVDLEVELERAELVDLLDRALALLPPATRDVLVRRYVEESPVGEIAARLGLTDAAVTMRLQRGRLVLKQALLTSFPDEAASYGLTAGEGWQTTRIWCPICGDHHLEARFLDGRDVLEKRCPGCAAATRSKQSRRTDFRWDDLKGFRPTLSRIFEWHRVNHLPGLATGRAPCPGCARPTPLVVERLSTAVPQWRISTTCPCGARAIETHEFLMLSLPEARRFWRDHPRIRLAGVRLLEAQGRPAVVTSYERVGGGARLDVLAAADTLRVLGVHRS